MRRTLSFVAVAATLSACGNSAPTALQGYVEGEYVRVAAPFAGTLVTLDAARGKSVEAGAPLFALEAQNEDAARREAGERVRKAAAQVDDLKKGKRVTEIPVHIAEKRPPSINLIKRVPNVLKSLVKLTYAIRIHG